ncbi:SMI1/KNR4 family protein [Psychrobacillus lasiicapitis]|uniref:SMI1/KNR4 family protein n=1 Tax=Psychrobacillus lasiicapitis TaxID=1636719 RepID=A0A544SRD4_9BACI|nr:SMI1/KNR4 family protein [Psychrobacillus lasiicapitis]TQR07764.1 SMI1/KNR4 family protein [Psychrobacillus lasiicapitis]GGA49158.1 SMI1/KNR4 family protein [Psychrobacillus lasiicapitis]
MWKKYIETISKEYNFKAPATNSEITLIKKELNVELPEKLLALFNETNGVFDKHDCPLIWSTQQIVEENLFFRNFDDYKDIFMPFDNLLFFSDGGNGDLFGFGILNGNIQRDDIFVWNHEDDSRNWIASSLEDFIKGWISSEISI